MYRGGLLFSILVTLLHASHLTAEVSGPKGCGPLCTQHGNCNLDTNSCECRFGHGGRDCTTHLAPACIKVEEMDLLDPRAMHWVVKSCECIRQFIDLVSVNVSGYGKATPTIFVEHAFHCFHRVGVPAQQQNSTWPKPHEEVTWHKIIAGFVKIEQNLTMEEAFKFQHFTFIPPNSTVVDGYRGHQNARKWEGQEQVQVYCDAGYTGGTCDEIEGSGCPLGCSDNGVCKANFCHCNPGYFGQDCSRNQAFPEPPEGSEYKSPTQFKIFVYELPSLLGYDTGNDAWYQADKEFYRKLVKDPIRTQNPWEASLFYIPENGYFTGSHSGDWWPHEHAVFQYVNKTYPFWNRTDGLDHFHFVTRDRGVCQLEQPRDAFITKPMKVTYFGYHSHNGSKGWNRWGWDQAHAEGCYRPMRDVVVPPNWTDLDKWIQSFRELPANWKRDVFFFFKGNPGGRSYMGYSGGVRQELNDLLANSTDPDVWFNNLDKHPNVTYQQAFERSLFCLAPYGQGWGVRLELALASGCIPVIIQDHVVQPFEPMLPYYDFSIRLPSKEIPNLISFLRRVSEEEIKRLQEGGRRYQNLFSWQESGEAYNCTIAALTSHWHLLKGEVEKRRRRQS